MKKRVIILFVTVLLCSTQITTATNSQPRIDYFVSSNGSGTVFWGVVMVPAQNELITHGELEYASNMSKGFAKARGFSSDYYTETESGENRWWMTQSKMYGLSMISWDHHYMLLLFYERESKGAYVIRGPLEMLILGPNIDLTNLEDLFNPKNSMTNFVGLYDNQWIEGKIYIFTGYLVEDNVEFGFVFVNLWIETLTSFVSLVWYWSIDGKVSLFIVEEEIFFIPVTRKMVIKVRM